MLLADILTAIDLLVPGDHPLETAEKTQAANMILPIYSVYNPYETAEDLDGDGTQVYDIITDLSNWSAGFSNIVRIEYPVDDDELPIILESDSDYKLQLFTDGYKLRFINATPSVIEDFRIVYTSLRAFADIPAIHEEGVKCLAASYFADMLSTYYAQMSDSIISADAVDHKSKSEQYAARAKVLRQIFYNAVGGKDGKPKPACGWVNWDLPESFLPTPGLG